MDAVPSPQSAILEVVRRYWGFDRLRPLQEDAIRASLAGRDSVVVMPTGGGKSLCYQVPAELTGRTDVVVSPLIALMKDQVDGLRACGYPAAALYSGMPLETLRQTEREIAGGRYRLVFMAPERLLTERGMHLARRLRVRAFAIDEAHCISHWGHDFRPEYRRLSALKDEFPDASVHAFTATATARVRADIAAQLRLSSPEILVGPFDRPNLVYRIVPRVDVYAQTLEVLRRHAGQAAIVYCLSRRETDAMAAYLQTAGIRAACYHAGMEADDRRRTQDAFASEQLDVVAATVAFGMGIDRSDVRAVIHATMPRSIEHYQQETGRAGRDGLEAECVLLYSAADVLRWEALFSKSVLESEMPEEAVQAKLALLKEMQRFLGVPACRHRRLVEYFGQSFQPTACGACDFCLGEIEGYSEATETAQKILSCVARVGERFGAAYVVDVLLGSNNERILSQQHHQLSTHGLMKGFEKKALLNLVYQLVDQDLLERTTDEFPVLKLNRASWEVMRGQRVVRLLQPKSAPVKRTRADLDSWEGVDRELFEELRRLRKDGAARRGVPPYVIFSDATLRDMARIRPTKRETFLAVHGVGKTKLDDFGESFMLCIAAFCRQHGRASDVMPRQRAGSPGPGNGNTGGRQASHSPARQKALELFAAGKPLDFVSEAVERSRGTTIKFLTEYIEQRRPPDVSAWLAPAQLRAVRDAVSEIGQTRLKLIFEHLKGQVDYDEIRIALAFLATRGSQDVLEAKAGTRKSG